DPNADQIIPLPFGGYFESTYDKNYVNPAINSTSPPRFDIQLLQNTSSQEFPPGNMDYLTISFVIPIIRSIGNISVYQISNPNDDSKLFIKVDILKATESDSEPTVQSIIDDLDMLIRNKKKYNYFL
ncbi:5367_t:CDS:2, partial [Racocetra fulgida]